VILVRRLVWSPLPWTELVEHLGRRSVPRPLGHQDRHRSLRADLADQPSLRPASRPKRRRQQHPCQRQVNHYP